MIHKITSFPQTQLMGVSIRTSNTREMNPDSAKIGATVARYFGEGLGEGVPNRVISERLFCVYTDYENQHFGDYTFFIGVEVAPESVAPEGYVSLLIPGQSYTCFTTSPGPMPDVCIGAWQKIWTMSDEVLGGHRSYGTDFEIYDGRAADPQNTVLDIYIGISIIERLQDPK